MRVKSDKHDEIVKEKNIEIEKLKIALEKYKSESDINIESILKQVAKYSLSV